MPRRRVIDAVLLDLNLADSKGLQGLRTFLQAHPGARVAVFSGTHDEFVIRQAEALGAAGYVCKGTLSTQMHDMLIALLWPEGHPARAARPLGARSFRACRRRRCTTACPNSGRATWRSWSSCCRVCTNQEISTSTQLSLGTVKNYVSSLLLALDVRSRSHLISLFR